MKCGEAHLSGTSPQTICVTIQPRQSNIMAICRRQARKYLFLMTQAQVFVVEGERVEITASNCSFTDLPRFGGGGGGERKLVPFTLNPSPSFSRDSRQLHVITSKFDWFTVLTVAFVIG